MSTLSQPRLRLGNNNQPGLFTVSQNGTGKTCKPWSEPLRCPLLLYVVLIVLGLIINISAVARTPDVNRSGQPITPTQKWSTTIVGIIIYLIVAYLFGMWMYNLCKKCQTVNAWLVFLMAVFFPLILALVFGVITAAVLGVGFMLFRT